MTSIAPELPGEQQRHAEDQSPMHLQEEEEASAAAGPGITVSLDGTDDDRAVGGRADDARSAARMDGGAPSSQHVDEQELMNLTRHTDSFGVEDEDDDDDDDDGGGDVENQRGGGRQVSLAEALLGDRKQAGFWERWLEKGFVSNVITFLIFLVGLAMRAAVGEDDEDADRAATFVLSFGLFGFSGGITNWLAVKMLFDKVGVEPYYLYGSGVIPRQFIAIRVAFKNMIMKMFFDKAFLEKYLNDRAKGLIDGLDLGGRLRAAMAEPSFDGLLTEKLTDLSAKPEGMLVQTMAPMFGGVEGMVPMLKPFLGAFGEELLKVLVEKFDVTELVPIDSVIREVETLLNEKLKLITPEMVKELMEEVIREHLGWLVVWGNVFGGAIGVASAAFGYGS